MSRSRLVCMINTHLRGVELKKGQVVSQEILDDASPAAIDELIDAGFLMEDVAVEVATEVATEVVDELTLASSAEEHHEKKKKGKK